MNNRADIQMVFVKTLFEEISDAYYLRSLLLQEPAF